MNTDDSQRGYDVVPVWLLRAAVMALAYLTCALCSWLIKDSPHPLLEALAPAAGVAPGFAAFHWLRQQRTRFHP